MDQASLRPHLEIIPPNTDAEIRAIGLKIRILHDRLNFR